MRIKSKICLVFLILSVTVGRAAPGSAAERPPNVLLIVADNQPASLIGAYGNDAIKTPNIDRLAAEGIRFEHAFAVNGVCSPTRATLMTGLLPSQTGVHVALQAQVDVPGWSAIEEFRTLPQTLNDAGYRTALIGKYHLGNHDEPQLGFEHWITFTSGHTTAFYDVPVIDNGKQYVVEQHLTDFWTDKAVEFLRQQDHDTPFFLYLSYNGPYMLPPSVTMEPRNRHAAYYAEHTPPFPQEPVHPYLRNWAKGRGPTGTMVDEGTTAWTAIGALNNRTAMINTAAETSMVDDGVGKVMAELAALGLDADTLVIYTSDQGASYGHHGIWGNTSWSYPFTVYNVNMQVPLILWHAGRIPASGSNERIVNQFDIFPTLVDYLGVDDKTIENSPGHSFAPMLAGKKTDWTDAAYFEFVTVRAIRTPEWKYMKRFDRDEPDTLFDMRRDPEETRNLLDQPEYADVAAELDGKLTDFFNRYANPRYDLWRGGTAKGRLLEEHYGKDHIFRDRFPDWQSPIIEKAQPYAANR
jgi:arylsulfatase A-like enzyme